MGKKRAKNQAVDPACDHEPRVFAEHEGSKIWACSCGEKQYVSGIATGGKLLELTGKDRIKAQAIDELHGKPAIDIPVKTPPKNVVQHSSATNEHYSPPLIVEPARRLMGGIDLDPASCEQANKVVQAHAIFTEEQDGLRFYWAREKYLIAEKNVDSAGLRVFLNPPGGIVRIGKTPFSSSAIWWAKLVQEWEAGRVEQAVFVGFTLEILRNTQVGQKVPVQWFHRCYPRERIDFLDEQGQPQGQPSHANLIVFLPPIRRGADGLVPGGWVAAFRKFEEEFGSLGFCEPGWGRFKESKS